MKKIPLTQGKFALVDNDMYAYLMQWKWTFIKRNDGVNGYAVRCKLKTIYMHREIMGASTILQIDHINHDSLDNRRSNLRLVTCQQNQFNRVPNINTSSKYKGVTWYKHDDKWGARINIDKHTKFLGLFSDEVDAALKYDNEAREHYGEFAYLNFPKSNQRII